MKLSRFARLACLLVAGMLLAACQHEAATPWQLTDISGHMPDLAFQLTDDQGKTVTATDYQGKVALLYFGYTHCPDVCPLTLAHLHVVMQRLGKVADGAQILFVSVDPARDTPAALHAYATAFDPHVIGLTGSPADIEALTKRYRAAFSREPGKEGGSYDVSHSSGIYIFDAHGKARLLATPTDSQDKLVHDLHLLLSPGGAT
ncbi:SCO family protein [Dyella nitratireducens]|uniref:Photosynthetic protein synthase I n=1 Tax=Dyella nitratireducens TaxID=1849580 RepID=A0ABQ1FN40_9GAMM|nr:SCO family protein [Dyella nitratireducens]GGA20444.1 photosynthetic protein synthase I [Dyella nitratireducens]GLQ44374.1 SCO1/SenC family protein [Dyella nitratireducens]